MNAEFNIGDRVTYKPYEKALPAKVIKISDTCGHSVKDERIYYHLSGPGVVAITTGMSILESRLYNPEAA